MAHTNANNGPPPWPTSTPMNGEHSSPPAPTTAHHNTNADNGPPQRRRRPTTLSDNGRAPRPTNGDCGSSHNSGVVNKEAAIVSRLVGDAKDRVQMEFDGRTGDTNIQGKTTGVYYNARENYRSNIWGDLYTRLL
ncbi:uncharacterized protein LACBIDRAFT_331242 [Laccaria bicolor S238N-H82]|uniref:Predicted protein n=1 Tax=Laccaria bicolor (strain S238N-H82 / ATCC MYA-4686) TaxID=486041 RepID=B0DNW6_LACBS|nr:uncharacterized protein LACBIDRAFT_331242 [Laccaria bicolor S238N-H82]EDR03725.1 predicted protein [Laccaria bicolor S238N-H82]|eukprot:XP_001885578.1 predicted protein [Laccaria bicolor S238N-H82]